MKREDFPLSDDDDPIDTLVAQAEEYVQQIPPIRGDLPKQSEESIVRFGFKVGQRLLDMAKRCASRDPRFDGDTSAYIRDAICDRNDKFIAQEKAGDLDIIWKQHQVIHEFKEIVINAKEIFEFIDNHCSDILTIRFKDRKRYTKLLYKAKEIYALSDSEDLERKLREVFPELEQFNV